MKKILKWVGIGVLVLGGLWAATFFIKSNSKGTVEFETHNPFVSSIEKKTVATGKVIPQEEVEIKPQITGIIDKIFVEEGTQVKAGELIAVIKVVPNEQALFQARGRVNNAKVALRNAELLFNRNKELFEKGVVSEQDFQDIELSFEQAKLELENAQNDYQIILKGSAGGSMSANTDIRATVDGTILEIPVEEGDQVIQSNNFNDGTTIAAVADLAKMIFEGKVDEGEVAKLEIGMPLTITLGAVEDKELEAQLKFIAPKGVEEAGAVQFKIEGDVAVSDDLFIRAGYSANASLVLEKKDSVLVIPEALLQFDKSTNKPYVEVSTGEQEFERRDIEIGISDGINVEIVSGLTEEDNVKQWNKTEPVKKGTEDEEEGEEEEESAE